MQDATPTGVCTEAGQLRGDYVAASSVLAAATLFRTGQAVRQAAAPGAFVNRDLYLLWPLAQRLGLRVNTTFEETDFEGLASSLLGTREAACASSPSPTVLISWNHCLIPALARALGCVDSACLSCWDDDDFDKVLWLQFALA
eukprot:CAMPEP_0168366080 /NCGR_PEP_ID=MMETSP0228-20121227/5044_1 /TAXON_ID=133427 /ORGANISM="Protoceratium reticulatum, Strain CCCM 535 (=CCMP 1889)" /LENGTH=142 /DNA_ID=CAMNT_0008378871 /DNA_START=1 /DNA_END=427 /DNA_ORIENTATION=-